ncbi:hypothetical protein PHJA_002350100 [Phtheirospermum japonicum]|uniref:Uncharacterized protein n=1 Tax=Phtheirospermum japonicum TaxID=374723 RepID=A0A830D6S9_9LAMI|nr:hypothetical protein PHJA_002350100 [Phtheirospermum japonicum]
MVSLLLNALLSNPSPSALISTNKFKTPSRSFHQKPLQIVSCREKTEYSTNNTQKLSYSQALVQIMFQKSAVIPLAASLAIVLWSNPAVKDYNIIQGLEYLETIYTVQAHAGFLSGLSGIESVPGPQLPQIDFLSRFNEENQKKYAENDARNRQQTLDKYCIRGAEWGVGDCSADAMSPEDKDKFIAMLKQKAGIE